MLGIEVVPSAKRLIKSARDLAYDLLTTVANIGDNSIEAGTRCHRHTAPCWCTTIPKWNKCRLAKAPITVILL